MGDLTPLVSQLKVAAGGATIAADDTVIIGRAPFAGTVTAVAFAPEADITGANTNSRTYSLINKGTDGNGTALVATLAMVSGVNASDFDEKAITLSATAANLVVAEGDVLAWTSVHVGTGIVDPGGLVTVDLTRS